MKYEDFIVRDQKICGGQPVVKGTRIPIRTVLASLAEGSSAQEILDDFPTLSVVSANLMSDVSSAHNTVV